MGEEMKRIKINIKRLILALTILVTVIGIKTNVSKKILAKNHNKNDFKSSEEEVKDVDISQYEEDNIPLHSKGDELDKDKDLKITKKEPMDYEKNKTKESNDYKEIFKDDLFLGDSITDSLSFYEFLEESNVIAKFGLTAKGAKDKIDNIIKVNPENIYIMLGMNDILTGIDSQRFVDNYIELINEIRERSPGTNIYIQSILSVDSKVKDLKPLLTNKNIDNFNEKLLDMAKDEDIEFLNIETILKDNEDLLEPDGIHVKYKFYKLWLDYLVENAKSRRDR